MFDLDIQKKLQSEVMVTYVEELKGDLGSSQSARFYRLPHRRTTPTRACNTLLSDGQLARNEMMI